MGDIIIALIILTFVALAIYKIRKDKKNGVRCSGCSSCEANKNCSHSKE